MIQLIAPVRRLRLGLWLRFGLRLRFCLAVIAGMLVVSSCSKHRATPTNPALESVYAVGWTAVTDGGLTAATVWKDGVESFLKNPLPQTTAGSVASAVTTSGSDIYIAGYAYNIGDTTAVYWKNGTPVVLGGGRAQGITVNGKDVYVVGVDTTLSRLCYWKNGAQTLFGFNTATNYVQSMALFGGDLYIGGAIDTSGLALACYWKNGQPVLLGYNSYVTTSAAWGLTISGYDLYFAGEADYRPYVPAASACYWKNGALVVMPHQGVVAGVTSAQAITVSAAHVYLAGTAWLQQGAAGILPVFWKDSVPTLLDTTGMRQGEPNAIIVDSPNVYIGGWYQQWGGPSSQPALWKNGKQQLPENLIGGVNGIVFVQE